MPGTLLIACIEQLDRIAATEELAMAGAVQLGNGWLKESDVTKGFAALRSRQAGEDPRPAPATPMELMAFMRGAGAAVVIV